MAAPTEKFMPAENSQDFDESCEIEVTVTSGFESVCQAEIKDKLGVESTSTRGHVYFKIATEDVLKTLELRCTENLFIIIKRYPSMDFTKDKEADLAKFNHIVPDLDWQLGLRIWSKFQHFSHPISATPLTMDEIESLRKQSPDLESSDTSTVIHRQPHYSFLPRYRATCYRTGQNHSFSSEHVARVFGGEINDYFNWGVDMENFDIEVVITVVDDDVRISIALTKETMHRRNIAKFGPTTLKPTIAYGLLRLCEIQTGDVVCDPMCGGGSIPIEGALNWPSAHHICGDIHDLAWRRTQENMEYVAQKLVQKDKPPLNMSVFRWDACNLPLRDESIDVMATDLPFGKRSGSKVRNTVLYPRALTEMARVTRLGSGRACLLTYDKKCLHRTLLALSHYWKWTSTVGINIGGLAAAAFILHRTYEKWRGPWIPHNKKQKSKSSDLKKETTYS